MTNEPGSITAPRRSCCLLRPEFVAAGRTGLLFEPGDSRDLILKVRQLWRDTAGRRTMCDECRDVFEQKYTAAANYRQLIEIYEQVLSRPIDTPRNVTPCIPAGV